MTQSFTKEKKEYLRIASRFLKEVGLYDLWIKYCYDHHTHKSWIDCEDIEVSDIIGKTCFTDYVLAHRPNLRLLFKGYLMYELFGEYLLEMYPQYRNNIHDHSYGRIFVDKEKKKVIIQ